MQKYTATLTRDIVTIEPKGARNMNKVYSDIVKAGLILPKKAKYTIVDVKKITVLCIKHNKQPIPQNSGLR